MPRRVALTFHDLLDPLSGERTSLRVEAGRVADRQTSLPGCGRDIDGAQLWVLPGLYDADQNLPLATTGIRERDRFASLSGGITTLNAGIVWQEIRRADFKGLVEEAKTETLPRVVPVLSVGRTDSQDFGSWLRANHRTVTELLPSVCKLYSNDPHLWAHFDALWAVDIVPLVYCDSQEALETVVDRAAGPLHFRHAISAKDVQTMHRVPGATVQTSPHFLLPIPDDHRPTLQVVPPVPDEDVRSTLVSVFLDGVDVVATDHNASPTIGATTGPGLEVAQDFLPAILAACELYGWPLRRVLDKATAAPALRFGIALAHSLVIVDPGPRDPAARWPQQSLNRAPFAHTVLRGRVVLCATFERACLI